MWPPALKSLLILAASFLTYMNSLEAGFVFDDHRGILTNDDLDPSKTSLWDVFQHDFWGVSIARSESHKSYRPLTVLSYRYLNYYFTELRPYSYHLVNVLMHGLCSVLFLAVAELVLGRRGGSWWAVSAASLFAVHSVHTEAVASTVGRAEILSCIFLLGALLVYSKAVSEESRGGSLVATGGTKWHYVILSVVLSTCSMLSKEQGITALGVCAGFDVLLHWEAVWTTFLKKIRSVAVSSDASKQGNGKALLGHHHNTKETLENSECMWLLARRLGVLISSGICLLCLRIWINHGTDPIFKPEELRAAFHPDRIVRILSFSNIYSLNAWLLLAPSALCCDWSLGSVPLVTSLTDVRNTWSLLLYTALLILVIHVLRSKRDRIAVGMALTLLLLPFLPASGIIFKVGFVIAERVLYMPSLGSCLLVTIGMRRTAHLIHSQIWKKFVSAIMISILLIMATKSVSRNQDWTTDFNLFESGVKTNPNNVKLRNNYATELKSANRITEARAQYEKTIEIDPDYGDVYYNYGTLLFDEGNFEAAVTSYEKAIEHPQMYSKTLNNLATTYFRLGHRQKAEETLVESIRLNPDQESSYNNLASLYAEAKRYRESEEMFKKALELNPTYTAAYFNLGTMLLQVGRIAEAESNLKQVLTLDPNHHGATNKLNAIYRHKKQLQQQGQ